MLTPVRAGPGGAHQMENAGANSTNVLCVAVPLAL